MIILVQFLCLAPFALILGLFVTRFVQLCINPKSV